MKPDLGTITNTSICVLMYFINLSCDILLSKLKILHKGGSLTQDGNICEETDCLKLQSVIIG